LVTRIGAVFEMLVQNPLAGRERPELAQGPRSFAVGNYVIFDIAGSNSIEVVRVMSSRQDVNADDMA
jgi:toxin ParE1/3/4